MIKNKQTFMKEAIHYIKEVFGLDLNFKEIKKEQMNALPLYIINEYVFWEGNMLDRNVMFAKKNTTGHLTPTQYKKQLDLLENTFDRIVVFILPDIEAYNRNRLIKNKINFIIANKQIFIPGLIVDIKEYKLKKPQKQYLQPATQCLILYHLQNKSLNHYNYKQLALIVKYPYLTISRAVENMLSLGLCKVEGTKEKSIYFEDNNKELWKKAFPYMKSPVMKNIFTDDEISTKLYYKTNINALSHYSDLNDEKQQYIAIHKDLFNQMHKKSELRKCSDYEGKYYLEVWNYDPAILSKNEYVDPLSVFLLFKDDIDERVQMALKNIIEQQKW